VHLDRLVDLEYLLPHAGRRGQSFAYEVIFDGDVATDRPQFIGLLDPQALRTEGDGSGEGSNHKIPDLDAKPEAKFAGVGEEFTGQAPEFAGPKRPQNGGVTAPKRPRDLGVNPWAPAPYARGPENGQQNRKAGEKSENGSASGSTATEGVL
jgi:hypothetical protein